MYIPIEDVVYAFTEGSEMLWTIRGTDPFTNEDLAIVIEADSAPEAEYFARRRGFPVVILEQATPLDIKAARAAGTLFHYSAPRRYRCFGWCLSTGQLTGLMASGLATIFMVLHAHSVPLPW
jgi:hypothetical protein